MLGTMRLSTDTSEVVIQGPSVDFQPTVPHKLYRHQPDSAHFNRAIALLGV